MSILSQEFYIIIDRVISVPGNIREVVDGFIAIDKRFILKLMSTMKLPDAKIYDTKMFMKTVTCTYDVSLAREFQKHLSNASCKHRIIYERKYKKGE